MTFGTNWTVQTETLDLSAQAIGDTLSIGTPAGYGTWSGYSTEDIAFYAFEPANTDVLTLAALLAASNNFTNALNIFQGIQASSVAVTGSSKFITTGTSSNTDLTGTVTLSGGTATYTLTGTYTTAPNCLSQDKTTPANVCSCAASTTQFTFTGTGSDQCKYISMGLN
jgi:hypothetical protein